VPEPHPSDHRPFKSDHNRAAFNRWHDQQIGQLSRVSANVFTLASAGLAYSLSLLADDNTELLRRNLATVRLFSVLFACSFVCAMAFALNRLEDFRRTKNLIRLRDDDPNHPELPRRRRTLDRIGVATWVLFYLQFGSFCLGSLAILVFIWCNYASKLK